MPAPLPQQDVSCREHVPLGTRKQALRVAASTHPSPTAASFGFHCPWHSGGKTGIKMGLRLLGGGLEPPPALPLSPEEMGCDLGLPGSRAEAVLLRSPAHRCVGSFR